MLPQPKFNNPTHDVVPDNNSYERMQLGSSRLSLEEKLGRRLAYSCLYCGGDGHYEFSCLLKDRTHQWRRAHWWVAQDALIVLHKLCSRVNSCSITWSVLPVPIVIDLGANKSLMDNNLPTRLGLTLEPLPKPIEASALDGCLLGEVNHHTQPVSLLITGNHCNPISFHILNTP